MMAQSALENSPRPTGTRVMLMATCLCDAFFDDVAAATVEVLERAGCQVVFPEDQTCCGQPPFNGGDFEASRSIVRHNLGVFAGELPIVVPSGSCAAMGFHGAPLAFEGEPDLADVQALGRRTWELSDFLVNGLGITTWAGRLEKKVAFHHSCHTRGTQSGAAAQTLLNSIEGLEMVKFGQGEQCCGFGGTFSVTFPNISAGMGQLKIDHLTKAQPDLVVSGDMSCLMHLKGLANNGSQAISVRHISQILRDAAAGVPSKE